MTAMMEILKQIQQDLAEQKNYMRNLHVIHKNINEKFNIMERKIDQQRVTTEMLEQQVRKNNVLLFGNEETAINFEDKPNLNNKEKTEHLVEQSEKYMENTESNQLQNSLKAAEVECNSECNSGEYEKTDSDKNKIGEFTPSEVKEIKELIKDYVTTTKPSVQEAVSRDRKQETVQISPTYFSADQMNKLNVELKRVAEKYQSTNISPVIEVIPGPLVNNHPVMIDLSKGVTYEAFYDYQQYGPCTIYLGSRGFKRSDIVEMIIENPNITLHDVVIEGLKARNEWWAENDLYYKYDFTKPFIGCLPPTEERY